MPHEEAAGSASQRKGQADKMQSSYEVYYAQKEQQH